MGKIVDKFPFNLGIGGLNGPDEDGGAVGEIYSFSDFVAFQWLYSR